MPLTRFANLPEERRREVLSKAARFFARHGFDEASYNELLAEIGFGKSQAYYYFESKRDLFVTACRASYAEFYAELDALPVPTSRVEYWDRVRQDTRRGFSFQTQHPLAAQLTLAVSRSALREGLAAEIVAGDEAGRRAYDEWLLLGQGLGAVRKDLPLELLRTLALSLSASIDSWFAERMNGASEEQMDRWSQSFADLYLRLLAPGPPLSEGKNR